MSRVVDFDEFVSLLTYPLKIISSTRIFSSVGVEAMHFLQCTKYHDHCKATLKDWIVVQVSVKGYRTKYISVDSEVRVEWINSPFLHSILK